LSIDRKQRIHAAISSRLAPSELVIKDESHLHAGHAGAQDGKGHFDLVIVSEQFAGADRLQRHRMVYDALSQLLQTDIHAIRIKALTAAEFKADDQASHKI
jgi:BolA protein